MLQIENIFKKFPAQQNAFGKTKSFVHAVNGVSLTIPRGKTVGLVGESGCGKSTLGRIIVGLEKPDAGDIRFKNKSLPEFNSAAMQDYRKSVQFIFQNPFGALNPRQRIYQMLMEVYKVHSPGKNGAREAEMLRLLSAVGLGREVLTKYPFEFSGGQRQRLCIARALAVNPELLICDEPVSALDVSVQSQILKLLKKLQKTLDLTYLFISHDLAVVYHMCDYIYIMYLGKIVEEGAVEDIFKSPRHPYTKALISAIPVPKPGQRKERIVLQGEIPDPTQLPAGCFFAGRCPEKMPVCEDTAPENFQFSSGHRAACHLFGEDATEKALKFPPPPDDNDVTNAKWNDDV